ncbi:inorganic phosphate transporter PHO84 [Nannizzia gypsea CBS 118893]|uniref:Inorganic phosphate transporter PHO84 n=1 Tax=Arthroderma gypseum (strain ATCC MYA-4604 / CBS 118893) TaxID=535722 RepID=E4UXI1_ARTGP|nr:inorganic phosphate transporter PHO84 [Nannizzia gypsea CBS 118893]EFR02715.1 inorganic phosphate transporter PHO84 [Nannizzia gypsea CBS 118893]
MKMPVSFKVKNRTVNFNYIPDLDLRRRRVFDELDATHFQSLVVFVAGIGFFTDGYDIFAVGMIIPMLAHVYWHGTMPMHIETGMRAATLLGTIIGQFVFGILADLYGRRKMYGFELLIVTLSTIGVTMASDGASGSMSIVAWLIVWRFIMGIGIGGDYPLSAVITSEFAPTRSRGRMISTVFYMQPCGYLAATLVALIAMAAHGGSIPHNIPTRVEDIVSCTDNPECRRAMDSVWRWVIGIGAVPSAIAIFFRFSIPESPRYTMEVLNRPDEALEDVNEMGWQRVPQKTMTPGDIEMQLPPLPDQHPQSQSQPMPEGNRIQTEKPPSLSVRPASAISQPSNQPISNDWSHFDPRQHHRSASRATTDGASQRSPRRVSRTHTISSAHSGAGSSLSFSTSNDDEPADSTLVEDDFAPPTKEASQWTHFRTGFYNHFITNGHWPTLLGTSLAWACFDFAFYALGPNSYKVVGKIFNEKVLCFPSVVKQGGKLPSPCLPPGRSLYEDGIQNAWHSLIIVSAGSITGGLGMIKIIKRTSPRTIQLYGFILLAVIFVIIGVCFQVVPRSASVPLIAFLYALSQVFFEIGPNVTTFMIPAELFPTRFRCTAHGISAMSGKIASVLVQAFVAYAPIGPYKPSDNNPSDSNSTDTKAQWLGFVVIIFAAFMVLGAAVTKWLIPEARQTDGLARPLEELQYLAKIRRPAKKKTAVSDAVDPQGASIPNNGANGVLARV